jgi:hypothetical protein
MFCRSLFVFNGVRVTGSLVLCVCFVDRCLFLVGFVLSTKHTYKTKDRVTQTPLKTNNDLQNIHIKLKIEKHKPH